MDRIMKSPLAALVTIAACALLMSCTRTGPFDGCLEDADCDPGMVCVMGECVPTDTDSSTV